MAKRRQNPEHGPMAPGVNQAELTVGLHAHQHDHKHHINISPFPSAEELQKYNQCDPNFSKIIMESFQKRVEADIEIDKQKIILEQEEQVLRRNEAEQEYKITSRGQWFAMGALIFLGALAFLFGAIGYEKTAATIAGTTILGAITAFAGLGRKKAHKPSGGQSLTKKD